MVSDLTTSDKVKVQCFFFHKLHVQWQQKKKKDKNNGSKKIQRNTRRLNAHFSLQRGARSPASEEDRIQVWASCEIKRMSAQVIITYSVPSTAVYKPRHHQLIKLGDSNTEAIVFGLSGHPLNADNNT